MAENATRFWRTMTFRQLNGRRVRLTAHNGELILEIKLAPGFGRSLGSRQNLIAGMKFGELFHEGHDGFMELSRQNADIEIELLPDKPTYETITDRDEIREGGHRSRQGRQPLSDPRCERRPYHHRCIRAKHHPQP